MGKGDGKRFWLYPLRGLAIFVIFFLIKLITSASIYSIANDNTLYLTEFPSQLVYIFAAVADLLILNSVIQLFTVYDRPSFGRFESEQLSEVRFFTEAPKILRSYEFISETAVILALTAICSVSGLFYEAVRCYFGDLPVPTAAARLLPIATLLPLFFLISLLCRYEVRRYWHSLIMARETEKLDSRARLIGRAVLIALLYPLAFPYIPYLVFMLITVFAVFAQLAKILTVIGLILAIALVILSFIGISRLRCRGLRKKFISELTKVAEKEGRSLEILEKRSAEVRGYDLVFTDGEQSYSIRIIRAPRRGVPLYFTSCSDAHFLHRIGTKNHHLSLERHFDYGFEADGIKILLIIKFPKRIFVSSDGATHKIFGGDKIWDYIVYDTRSFLGSADRGCLDRFNNTME